MSQDITKSDSDRALYNKEFTNLGAFITNSETKDFNGVSLFSSTGQNVNIDSEGATFTLAGVDLSASSYSTATSATISTTTTAASALTSVKNAINLLASDRASVGANISRLNSHSEQLGVLGDNQIGRAHV